MLGVQKGAKVKVFASWQPRVDYQMITRADGPKMLGEEIVGLKFASGGGISMLNHMTAMIMKKNGFDHTQNQHVPIGGHSDRLAAVIAGKAQLSLVNTLTATRAGDQINIVTPVAKELGGIGYVYLAAREETLNDPERRAALKKYVKGFVQGARYAIENPDYAAEALIKRAPENRWSWSRRSCASSTRSPCGASMAASPTRSPSSRPPPISSTRSSRSP